MKGSIILEVDASFENALRIQNSQNYILSINQGKGEEKMNAFQKEDQRVN